MTRKVFTSRTPYLTYQTCPRKRWLEQHSGDHGRGIEPARKNWHLALGSAVHEGLATLLKMADQWDAGGTDWQRGIEDGAVANALAAYDRETASGLDMGAEQSAAVVTDPRGESLTGLLRESLLVEEKGDRDGRGLAGQVSEGAFRSDFDFSGGLGVGDAGGLDTPAAGSLIPSPADYTRRELRALTEAMVRAYARRRLRALLAEFDVLEVEREGEWKVADLEPVEHDWNGDHICKRCGYKARPNDGYRFPTTADWECPVSLWFASRPDALLLHRATQTLHIMSFKTTGQWDVRRAKDAERDVQGLSEGVEVERRLAGWWNELNRDEHKWRPDNPNDPSERMHLFLASCPAPPRIHAIRYEYLLKGTRKVEDRGPLVGQWTQRSPLIRGYYDDKSGVWAHSWQYTEEDELGTTVVRKLNWAKFKGRPAWDSYYGMGESASVLAWIDALDRGVIQPGAGDILAEQFPAPITVYRNDDDLRDWLEQVEAQEVRVARDVARIQTATLGKPEDLDAFYPKRSELNILFPQHRRSCSYPSDCQFIPVCFGSAEMREDPEASGLFRQRELNHPQEAGQ